jgi:hypothetical protein
MKRNLDLVRKLLLYFEEKPDDQVERCPPIEGYSSLEIKYHLLLMDEAGLLRCEREVTSSGRTIYVLPMSLTWQGHEFLEAARNSNFWQKAKTIVYEKSGALSFEMLKSVLLHLSKEGIQAFTS